MVNDNGLYDEFFQIWVAFFSDRYGSYYITRGKTWDVGSCVMGDVF